MAHIPDGVLSAPVLITGALASAVLVALALRRLDYEHLPRAAVLSSALFVSSLISIPIGPTSAHLLLNGLMGLLLGWTAIPAILVALTLQAAFFGFGGLLALGCNTLNMALPALFCALVLAPRLGRLPPRWRPWIGFAAGALGVILTGLLIAISLGLSNAAFLPAARILLLAYLPLALVEGVITATVLGFLQRVAPEMLTAGDTTHA